MNGILMAVENVLHRTGHTRERTSREATTLGYTLLILLFGGIYGGVMGLFGGVAADRWLQPIYAAIKVPALLLATFVLALPSFFILNTLFGLRRDFPKVVLALVAAQAGLAIVLASLAPYTLLWYLSFSDYESAIAFNALMFGLASLTGQWLLQGYYRDLIAQNRKHRWLLWTWIGIYALVGIQMGWVLRPFVGAEGVPIQFLRPSAWDNAYVIVFRVIWQAMFD